MRRPGRRAHLGPDLGVLGEPRVNVLELNIAVRAGRADRLSDDDGMDVDRRRGRLTVYLGAAPGVGKTYAMLGEAQRRLRARHRRGGRVRRDARPRADRRRSSTGSRWCRARRSPTAARPSPRWTPTPSSPAGRRSCCVDELAHTNVPGSRHEKRAAGRRGDPRGGHRRDHHRQHPAPRVAQRRGRADHRRPAARDRAGRGGPHRRPDPAGRHVARRAAPPDGARQHLPARADRRLAHVVLPGRQPDRAARAGPAVAGRPGRRRARRLPARAPDRGAVAGQGADRRRGHRRRRERDAAAARRPARPARGRAPSCWRCT